MSDSRLTPSLLVKACKRFRKDLVRGRMFSTCSGRCYRETCTNCPACRLLSDRPSEDGLDEYRVLELLDWEPEKKA
ncbi:hypothetical protein [Ktedonospora formicarum]|uniref:Uncharacterized protein n=1 Tax=Ktedonospora formicarum TaxID=2778364 RepID=A0A8J3I3K9_9CHLR|nr:hypothetical protein [Ktedonospora formicarum]GHO48141.1 hypothetical protein KSX_63040 [Ktedonospora formicarum]